MIGEILRRSIEDKLDKYLQTMSVVVIIGARQTGKTTLAQQLVGGQHRFFQSR